MLGQTVGRGLCRGSLQIVKIAVLLLVFHETLSHVIEHLFGELLGLRMA